MQKHGFKPLQEIINTNKRPKLQDRRRAKRKIN